jgi:hypothetical protein
MTPAYDLVKSPFELLESLGRLLHLAALVVLCSATVLQLLVDNELTGLMAIRLDTCCVVLSSAT